MSMRQTTHSGELPTFVARADITSYRAPQCGQKNFPAIAVFHSWAMLRSHAVGQTAIMYYVYQTFGGKKSPCGRMSTPPAESRQNTGIAGDSFSLGSAGSKS